MSEDIIVLLKDGRWATMEEGELLENRFGKGVTRLDAAGYVRPEHVIQSTVRAAERRRMTTATPEGEDAA